MKKFLSIFVMSALLIISTAAVGFAQEEVNVFHWWTAGGEKEAIDAVEEAFEEKYPNVNLNQHPIAGGGGGVMRSKVKTMYTAGNPPECFQLTYGSGMLSSFKPMLQPVDQFFEDFNIPEQVKQWGTVGEHQYAVPLNIHRNNCLWYNKHILEEAGVSTPIETMDDFLTAMGKIKEAGYTPLAIGHGSGQKFWWNLVFESILCGVESGNYKTLEKYYDGELNLTESEAFRDALEVMKKMFENGYVNEDYSARTWDQACSLVSNKEAAFNIMGDWAKANLMSKGMEPNEDFGFMPVPGNSNLFIGHGDGFVMPKGIEKEAAKKWYKFLTTVKAETVFNPIKGATPPRVDAPIEGKYDEIQIEIIKGFRDEDVVKTLSSLGGPPERHVDIFGTALSEFVVDLDVDKAIKNMQKQYNKIYNQ